MSPERVYPYQGESHSLDESLSRRAGLGRGFQVQAGRVDLGFGEEHERPAFTSFSELMRVPFLGADPPGEDVGRGVKDAVWSRQ